MGKVKIKVAWSKWTEGPLSKDEYGVHELQVPFDTEHGSMRILGVSTIDAEVDDDTKTKGYIIDQVFPTLDQRDIDNLVGKLLTYVDATFTDVEQRKAHKDILRSSLWDWFELKHKSARDNLK